MSFLSRIQEAKEALAATKKPSSSLELKYGNIKDAKVAWRLYFKLFLINLKQLTTQRTHVYADVVSFPLNEKQKNCLNDILNFLHETVSYMATAVLEFTYLMQKFNDNETFQMILAEFYADVAFQFTALKQKVTDYKDQAISLHITHTETYKKLLKYLDEISALNVDVFVHEHLLKNKIPLETFDDEFL
jgi:hypothetical protein